MTTSGSLGDLDGGTVRLELWSVFRDGSPTVTTGPASTLDIPFEAAPETADLVVSATAATRCLAGKAYVAVQATNTDSVAADITLTTPYGSRTVTGVEPGKSAYQSFGARAPGVEAGRAQVTMRSGGRSAGADVAYDATLCG
ncbi:hypothetical protein [Cellulosimicrobium arenosum]|uniref:hypothetical protein n=1 Tax=Cellulosimicrobium arenosum TaxID=2708133 RepID=UPI0019D6AD21|nr:hypothetical protein [Cellulosimicrobium arenosum]